MPCQEGKGSSLPNREVTFVFFNYGLHESIKSDLENYKTKGTGKLNKDSYSYSGDD